MSPDPPRGFSTTGRGLGTTRHQARWALIGAVISGALIDLARGGDRVDCEPQRVTGDGHYWAYRIIDGRECWYPGRPLPRARPWTSPRPRPRPCPPSRPPASCLRHRRNRRSPRQGRRNGARPPPTSCSRSSVVGRSWRSPPSRRPGRWPCYR